MAHKMDYFLSSRTRVPSRQVQLTHAQAKGMVDTLTHTIQREFRDFGVSEITGGGSFGLGTVVMEKYDTDLVIHSSDITVEQISEKDGNYKEWLTKMDTFLRIKFGCDYKKSRMTLRCLQFKFREVMEVNLLVSPHCTDQHEFYHYLQHIPKDKWDNFAVCAAKWQVEFIKRQPEQVKELIGKAKAWRDREWPTDRDGEGRPSSYLLALLVIAAYEKNPIDVTAVFKRLIKGNINICWAGPGCLYEKRDYPDLLPPRPRVVDPANPANNVWRSGLKDCHQGERPSDYEPGNGKSVVFTDKMKDRCTSLSLD